MLKELVGMVKDSSVKEAKKVVKEEVKKTINETKEKVKTETDKLTNGNNGKVLIFVSIGLSLLAVGIALTTRKASNPIIVNVYTCK